MLASACRFHRHLPPTPPLPDPILGGDGNPFVSGAGPPYTFFSIDMCVLSFIFIYFFARLSYTRDNNYENVGNIVILDNVASLL